MRLRADPGWPFSDLQGPHPVPAALLAPAVASHSALASRVVCIPVRTSPAGPRVGGLSKFRIIRDTRNKYTDLAGGLGGVGGTPSGQ
jgi:hypothetical protein